jgi:fumarate reductase flavoprotein subunit
MIASHTLIRRRKLLLAAGYAAIGAALPGDAFAASQRNAYDLIIVGGGTAGMPAAIFAARRGLRVLVLEAAADVGGTLYLSTGQMSAAGTKLQAAKHIVDSPQDHYDDVMRISHGTANQTLVRLAVWNAAPTFDWLMDNGFTVLPDHPVLGGGHEPYRQRRYAWGPENGISILNTLRPLFDAGVASGAITVKTSARARQLLQRKGQVIGVKCEADNGAMTDYFGGSVLLSSGGFAMNGPMFERITGHKQYDANAYPYSQGDGITMGLDAGAYLRGQENYLPLFGFVMADNTIPSVWLAFPMTYPEARMPWEIWVNTHGQRFVAEDSSSVDAREYALADQPDMRFWIIADQAIFDASSSIINGWDKAKVMASFNTLPAFRSAPTLDALARDCGIDPDGLAQSVARYNAAQASGVDADFGRTHMPAQISKGPFYAVRCQGNDITTAAGLAVDDRLHVIRKDGTPIGGLFAAGEILGAGNLMGKATVNGMMVTPALTFGRLIGSEFAPKAT